MNSLKMKTLFLAVLGLVSADALAAVPNVPEVDGTGSIVALGVAAGLVALMRDRWGKRP